jgi:hypothetical protein
MGAMKKFMTLAMLLSTSCTPLTKEITEEKFVYLGKSDFAFYINRCNDKDKVCLHYCVEESREEGEKKLRDLAKSASVEEAWMYIEGEKGGKHIAMWCENGKNESPWHGQAIVPFYILKSFDKAYVSFYHIHPDDDRLESCSPSLTDFIGFFQIQHALNNLKSIEDADFRIITPIGIYKIKLPEFNREKLGAVLYNYEMERLQLQYNYTIKKQQLQPDDIDGLLRILLDAGFKVELY